MRLVYVDIDVNRDGGATHTVRFLVDSGAAYSVLPQQVWRKLGLKAKRTLEFTLADGTLIRRRVSECRFTYQGIDASTPVIR
jgi:predicted aspartyl protease